jgi:hypothetical protein
MCGLSSGLPDGLFFNPNLGKFWSALHWKKLYIIWLFGLFNGHLAYLIANWYILGHLVYFSQFWYNCTKKSGNPVIHLFFIEKVGAFSKPLESTFSRSIFKAEYFVSSIL